MDAIWLSAPAMALHVAVGPDGRPAGVRPNAAAERWAAAQGHAPAAWGPFAAQALALLPPALPGAGPQTGAPATIALSLGQRSLRLTGIRDASGWLLWLEPVAPPVSAKLPADAAPGPVTVGARDGGLPGGDAGVLERALALAGVTVWRRDLNSDRMSFNAIGNRAFGLPADTPDVSAAAVREAIHPDDVAAVERAAAEAIATGRVVDVIARYRSADGSWRSRLSRRIAERDAQGRVVALAGIAIGVDEQLRERERADVLAQRARLVADTLGVGFWSVDLDTGKMDYDDQMFRIYGLDPARGAPRVSEWIETLVHPADRAWVAERRQRADERWDAITEMVFRSHDDAAGQERWIHSWSCRAEHEGRRMLFGMHLDVSDRQRAEHRLLRERERAQFALDAAGIGVWERDAEGRIVYWNEAMYRLGGLDPRDPRPPHELAALVTEPDDLARGAELFRRHVAGGEPYRTELRLRQPDGQERVVMTHGRAMVDAAGRVLGVIGVHVDITERKRAEAIEREKQRIEQSSRDKSAFMARMSHELRTPLNAVLGFSRLLEDDLDEPPTPRQRERLQRIAGAGSQLLALVDEMLELARAEAESVAPARREALALAGVIEAVQRRVAGTAAAHGVAIDVEPVDPGLAVLGEAMRLQRALQLLLEHALRRSPAGARIVVAAQRLPAADAGPERVRVAVRDGGPGLTPHQHLWLFEPFVGDAAADASAPGNAATDDDSGVRLALARALVQSIGGEARAAARSDASGADGMELEVDLPGATLPSAGAAAAAAGGAGRGDALGARPPAHRGGARSEQLSVVCVEDNPVNLQLVCELIALRPGVRLRTAVDGRSGLALARDEPPDLMLLDLQLPDLHGSEVMRQLRADPAFADCTFVALSADAMPDHVSAALAAGFDAYWTKPIDFGHFLGELDRMARHHRERVRAAAADAAE